MKFKVGNEVRITNIDTWRAPSETIGKTGVIIGETIDTAHTHGYHVAINFDFGIWSYTESELELVESFTKEEPQATNDEQELYLTCPYDDPAAYPEDSYIDTKEEILKVIQVRYETDKEYQVYKLVPVFRVKLEINTRIIEED